MTVATKTDYQSARRYLMRKDLVLGTVIKQVGPCGLPNLPQYPPFMALAEAIASQQLSVKAADTIFGRFCTLFAPDKLPDPVRLLTFDDATIRGVGFSRSKMLFLRDLATHVVEKRLLLDRLHEHNDAQVLQQLTAVKGIGPWTAEIFLMFRLQRPDVFPVADLGLVKAAQRLYRMRQPPTREKLLKLAEAWRPYRSIAAWYLWRSLSLPSPVATTLMSPTKRRTPESRSRRPPPV
ncbi:MAG: DNA-3-methyladenine glycosylase 2 family protein [Acidobacteria bacterium]|nr:DNA-3-methyladenine glycosylase 2 family protein [Acidobacteriota bacterium]